MRSAGKRRVGTLVGLTAAVCLTAAVAQARVVRQYRVAHGAHIAVKVDSVDYRSDLTRVYGKLIGKPHTSQRIDSISLAVDGSTFRAADIDGVDFRRWFQWEEAGTIAVEIDFEAMTQVSSGKLIITTARGVDTLRIDRP
jgi:hypothetical protein